MWQCINQNPGFVELKRSRTRPELGICTVSLDGAFKILRPPLRCCPNTSSNRPFCTTSVIYSAVIGIRGERGTISSTWKSCPCKWNGCVSIIGCFVSSNNISSTILFFSTASRWAHGHWRYPAQRSGKLFSSHHVPPPTSSSDSVISSGCVSGGNDGNANVMLSTAPTIVDRPRPKSELMEKGLLFRNRN